MLNIKNLIIKYRKRITIIALLFAVVFITYFIGGRGSTTDIGSRAGESRTAQSVNTYDTKDRNGEIRGDKSENTVEDTTEAEHDEPAPEPNSEGISKPPEPKNADVADKKLTCTLSVRCDTVLKNMDKLDPEKAGLIPSDGVIFESKTVTFSEGESVFDILLRELNNNKIHIEFSMTPVYNSAYIEGINNLYEFDCGELSGWMYKVNGKFPNYGCSKYILNQGDIVEWVYSCDLGKDVGNSYAYEGGR